MEIEVELARATFIIGLVATAFVYERWRMLTGGTITGSYIAYLLSIGFFVDVIGWLLLSLFGYLVITVVSHILPVPRRWLFYTGIIAAGVLHASADSIAELPLFNALSSYLTAGMYVTSGLTAYDFKRQGVFKTLAVLSMILVLALAIILPLRWLLTSSAAPEFPTTYEEIEPIVMVVTLIASALVSTTLGLGSAGIIGAVFLWQILSLESLIVILGITIIGTQIYKYLSKWLLLTPRQESQAILIVGGISSWFGLFWAQWFGIAGAGTPYEYSLEPLIVIGLMILESSRIGYLKSFTGTAIVLSAVALASYLLTIGGIIPWIAVFGLLVALLIMFYFGIEKIIRDTDFEIEISKRYSIPTHPNNQRILSKHPKPDQFS